MGPPELSRDWRCGEPGQAPTPEQQGAGRYVVGGGCCSLVSRKVSWLHTVQIRPSLDSKHRLSLFFLSPHPLGLAVPLKASRTPAPRTQLPVYQVGNFNSFIVIIIIIDFRERGEGRGGERNMDLLFHLPMHSLSDVRALIGDGTCNLGTSDEVLTN